MLSNQESGETESFAGNLLEYPQYSRPEEWHGKKVPEVLMSGHHANIETVSYTHLDVYKRQVLCQAVLLRITATFLAAAVRSKNWNPV